MKVYPPNRKSKLHHLIMDIILREPITTAYKDQGKFWYVIKLNKGHYLHYTFNWQAERDIIIYKISPHIYSS